MRSFFVIFTLVGYTIQNNDKTNEEWGKVTLSPVGYTIQNNDKTNR